MEGKGAPDPGRIVFNACLVNKEIERDMLDAVEFGMRDLAEKKEEKEKQELRKKLFVIISKWRKKNEKSPNLILYVQQLAKEKAKKEIRVIGSTKSLTKNKISLIDPKTGKLKLWSPISYGAGIRAILQRGTTLFTRIRTTYSRVGAHRAAMECLVTPDKITRKLGIAAMKQRVKEKRGDIDDDGVRFIFSLALTDPASLNNPDLYLLPESIKNNITITGVQEELKNSTDDEIKTIQKAVKDMDFSSKAWRLLQVWVW